MDPTDPISEDMYVTCTLCHKLFKEQKYLEKHMKLKHQDVKEETIKGVIEGDDNDHKETFDFSINDTLIEVNDNDNKETIKDIIKVDNYDHKEASNNIQCSVCGKYYDNMTDYTHHLKTHLNDQDKVRNINIFKCKECDRKFLDEFFLNKHMKTHRMVQCHVCNKMCDSDYALTRHMHTHFNIKCPRCELVFDSNAKLSRHLKIHKVLARFVFGKPSGLKTKQMKQKRGAQVHKIHKERGVRYCHEKTDLKVFVGVIQKEGWVCVAVPILLLV